MTGIIETLRDLYATDKAAFLSRAPELFRMADEGYILECPLTKGQTVYIVHQSTRPPNEQYVSEYKVTEIMYFSNRGVRPFIFCCFGGYRFDNCDIGDIVFLTRPEAERRLESEKK